MLANNHVLDFGRSGLLETLTVLHKAGINSAGAGRDMTKAGAPAVIPTANLKRVLVFAFGCTSSGIPLGWAVDRDVPGVNLLRDLSDRTVRAIAEQVKAVRHSGDLTVVSIHWGGNWGYTVGPDEARFAHGLIDTAGVDVIHGHSSHHPKAIEIYHGKPILYRRGDFINDYEGIGGYEAFRSELTLMYLPQFDNQARLVELRLVPFSIRRFRLQRASRDEALWLCATLDRESAKFATRVLLTADQGLLVRVQ